MKKITKSIIALSVLAGLASCAKEQTPVTPDDNDGMVELTLTATQENPETRTQIGKTTQKTTAILWTDGDRMSVFDNSFTNYEFTLSSGAGETSGTFTGKVAENATLAFAFYPYSKSMSISETGILSGAELKSEQTAKDGSFDPETALMMGMISNNSITMGNLVGYVRVTPPFNCKKITLESKSATDVLAGKWNIAIGQTDKSSYSDPSNKVSISGDIKADKAYYIAVLPVEMTSGFKLIFTMEDGTEKYREGTKTLKISASAVKNLGEIKDTDLKVDYEDLSATESANCYLIQKAGYYKFQAVQGNTYKKDDSSKTGTSVGTVNSVEVLWESDGTATAPAVGTLIAEASYDNGYIQFSTPSTFKQGNAVIAAKDASDTILWSWHIWCASEGWKEQDYYNNAGTMMDRNLGATSASASEVGSIGLLYQWGRKDPFLGSSSVSSSTQAASTGTWSTSSESVTENSTKNPMTFYTGNSNGMPDDSWGWTSTGTKKSVNDPCPAGWRVPDGGSSGIWANASSTSSNSFEDYGMYFGSAKTIWYPASGYLSYSSGVLYNVGNFGYFWSVTPVSSNSNNAYILNFSSSGKVSPSSNLYRSSGGAVRCLQE